MPDPLLRPAGSDRSIRRVGTPRTRTRDADSGVCDRRSVRGPLVQSFARRGYPPAPYTAGCALKRAGGWSRKDTGGC